MALRAIVRRTVPVVSLARENELLRQGVPMTSQLELSSRAALCRQLAKREPANRALWLAEAENWLRLSKDKLRAEVTAFCHSRCLKASGGGRECRG